MMTMYGGKRHGLSGIPMYRSPFCPVCGEASFSIVSSSGNGGIVDPQVGFSMGYGHPSSFRISLVFLTMSLLQLVRRHRWAFVNLFQQAQRAVFAPAL